MSADCHAGLGGCRAAQGWLVFARELSVNPMSLPHCEVSNAHCA